METTNRQDQVTRSNVEFMNTTALHSLPFETQGNLGRPRSWRPSLEVSWTSGLLSVALAFCVSLPALAQPPLPRGYSIPIVDLDDDQSRLVVVDREPGQYLGHPTTVLLENGKTILCVYPKGHGRGAIVIFSNDEGQGWTEARELSAALTGDRHTGRYAPDGRLFISFRDTTLESPPRGDWVGWVGTYEDIVKGREGQYRVRLKHNCKGLDCAYPGVEVLPDGTFVVTTYGTWIANDPPYILSERFKLEELDAKLPADHRTRGRTK